ncbi:hypothetical protein D9619_011131 [Psilocybe cf. subviscida]|uniref:Uncharacterized protein n=1 Tax=Psilocybe cf. subviscida TaxID=2480587 RepID=A0A8H5BJ82_9AGAR|nr:hypothetical protein D9619_011131 [Psilocybe cf. subviscida]
MDVELCSFTKHADGHSDVAMGALPLPSLLFHNFARVKPAIIRELRHGLGSLDRTCFPQHHQAKGTPCSLYVARPSSSSMAAFSASFAQPVIPTGRLYQRTVYTLTVAPQTASSVRTLPPSKKQLDAFVTHAIHVGDELNTATGAVISSIPLRPLPAGDLLDPPLHRWTNTALRHSFVRACIRLRRPLLPRSQRAHNDAFGGVFLCISCVAFIRRSFHCTFLDPDSASDEESLTRPSRIQSLPNPTLCDVDTLINATFDPVLCETAATGYECAPASPAKVCQWAERCCYGRSHSAQTSMASSVNPSSQTNSEFLDHVIGGDRSLLTIFMHAEAL